MNYEIQSHDDALLDRLVDGELSADERRQLIASFDAQSDGWRRCALAFLEAQQWGNAMRQMVRPQATAIATIAPNSASTIEVASAATPASEGRRRQASRAGAWFASAAAVLVAFTLGWQMHGGGEATNAELLVDSGNSDVPPVGMVPPDAAAERLADADAITLVVQDASGQPRRVQVPLIEGHRLGEQFGSSPQWAPPKLRRQLAEQGMDLKARRRYAPLYFEQQNGVVPMVVPVDDAVITPVSRTMY